MSFFVKRALGKKSGSQKPGHESAGTLSLQHVYEIASIKQLDHPGLPVKSLCSSIIGTCRSMGVNIAKPPDMQPAPESAVDM